MNVENSGERTNGRSVFFKFLAKLKNVTAEDKSSSIRCIHLREKV